MAFFNPLIWETFDDNPQPMICSGSVGIWTQSLSNPWQLAKISNGFAMSSPSLTESTSFASSPSALFPFAFAPLDISIHLFLTPILFVMQCKQSNRSRSPRLRTEPHGPQTGLYQSGLDRPPRGRPQNGLLRPDRWTCLSNSLTVPPTQSRK